MAVLFARVTLGISNPFLVPNAVTSMSRAAELLGAAPLKFIPTLWAPMSVVKRINAKKAKIDFVATLIIVIVWFLN